MRWMLRCLLLGFLASSIAGCDASPTDVRRADQRVTLRPHLENPRATVLPAFMYTPSVWPQQGWFSDVNDANLIVGMANGNAVAVQLGGALVNLSNGPGNWSRAAAVNLRGAIVGGVDLGTLGQPNYVPAFWAHVGATPILLPDLGEAADINDHSVVVGGVTNRRGQGIAFYWDPNSGSLERLPSLPGGRNASAGSINNDHIVLGWSDATAPGWHPVLWQRNGSTWTVRQIMGGIEGYDIDGGYGIVGHTNQSASYGTPDHLGYYNTTGPSYAMAVSGKGVVAGYDYGVPAPGGWYNSASAFVADQTGSTTYLPLPPGTWKASFGYGLNRCGVVVGQLWTQAGAQPSVWDPGC